MHRNASIYSDPVHKAIWDRHPLKAKGKYGCAKCHTPSDKKLLANLKEGKSALPQKGDMLQEEGISCVSCHTISHIEEHPKSNANVYSEKNKYFFSANKSKKGEKNISFSKESSFFGLVTNKTGSPYHKIDYSNENFYNGKMCLGCHSHKQNALKFEVCRTGDKTKSDGKNCITCHMPMVSGTMNTVETTKQHRYHGFTGAANHPEMLSEYVDLGFRHSDDKFIITVKNDANHELFLHPLRVAQLHVSVQRKGKTTPLAPVTFIRVIGKEGKPSMPWLADSVVKDTQIKAGESRDISFEYPLQKGDTIEAELGFYRVNPKAAKKLGLTNEKGDTSFQLLKKKLFIVR